MSSRDARGVVGEYLEPFDRADFLTPVNEALGRRSALGDEGAVRSIGPAWSVLSPDLVWDTSPIAGGSSDENVYRAGTTWRSTCELGRRSRSSTG